MPGTQFQQEWTKDLWFQKIKKNNTKLDFYFYILSKCDAWLCKVTWF